MQKRKLYNVMQMLVGVLLIVVFYRWIEKNEGEPLKPGQQAPLNHGFVQSFDNQVMDIKQWLNKPLLLIFWASWCLPCLQELPRMNELAKKYQKDFNFLAIAVDSSAKDVIRVVEKYKLQFFIAKASDHFLSDWGVGRLPLIYLMKPNGIVHNVFIGQSDTALIEESMRTINAFDK